MNSAISIYFSSSSPFQNSNLQPPLKIFLLPIFPIFPLLVFIPQAISLIKTLINAI